MVYEDREDEFMSIDEQEMFDQEAYDENFLDTFREQISSDDAEALEPDEVLEGETATAAADVESGFRESINSDTNPHLDDQLEDEGLSEEAKKDFRDKSEGTED